MWNAPGVIEGRLMPIPRRDSNVADSADKRPGGGMGTAGPPTSYESVPRENLRYPGYVFMSLGLGIAFWKVCARKENWFLHFSQIKVTTPKINNTQAAVLLESQWHWPWSSPQSLGRKYTAVKFKQNIAEMKWN